MICLYWALRTVCAVCLFGLSLRLLVPGCDCAVGYHFWIGACFLYSLSEGSVAHVNLNKCICVYFGVSK